MPPIWFFSDPQPGETTTAFKSVDIIGTKAGKKHDVITLNNDAPTGGGVCREKKAAYSCWSGRPVA